MQRSPVISVLAVAIHLRSVGELRVVLAGAMPTSGRDRVDAARGAEASACGIRRAQPATPRGDARGLRGRLRSCTWPFGTSLAKTSWSP